MPHWVHISTHFNNGTVSCEDSSSTFLRFAQCISNYHITTVIIQTCPMFIIYIFNTHINHSIIRLTWNQPFHYKMHTVSDSTSILLYLPRQVVLPLNGCWHFSLAHCTLQSLDCHLMWDFYNGGGVIGGGSTSKDSSYIVTATLQALGQHLTQFLPSGWLPTLYQKLALCFTASYGSLLQKICHYNAIHVPQSQHNC
jgi:hypothetical protein